MGKYLFLTKTATIEQFNSSTLSFTFMTGHPSDVLPSRSIVPYYEMPIYKTQGPSDISARELQVVAARFPRSLRCMGE